eukprot:CAMPEP_0119113516 /NCGR_PEP_ID=MMETSP1180-20130426/44220_1 /TAXON_ID=3052 ORGANISM="Chlamydomonas cf sp, Strain CCMP681" /NCGR_SAMPLE_ID=MMETSP1180 /ASSEMBLY_ACC=CAM_ASM_000741 /LENGTH=78 /DNA_ID=CAMNT_0007101647 /DNA_START=218 /DNA_END=452 /DNA_ORIENTATION=-
MSPGCAIERSDSTLRWPFEAVCAGGSSGMAHAWEDHVAAAVGPDWSWLDPLAAKASPQAPPQWSAAGTEPLQPSPDPE